VASKGQVHFASVILDVDLTLCTIEGINWLAARRDPSVASRVADLTRKAMNGDAPLETVYGDRLAAIRPNRTDVAALAAAYQDAVSPGAVQALAAFRSRGVKIVAVTSGIRDAVLPMASALGFTPADVFAVDIRFDDKGNYAGFVAETPLVKASGKREIVEQLALPRRRLMVGDGSTDALVRPAVDAFAAFTGVIRRDGVARDANYVVASFEALERIVLS